MKNSPRPVLDKAAFAAATLVPLIALLCIVFIRPFWGPMDDNNFVLEFIPKLLREGLFSTSVEYARGDLNWGMFRPLYPSMALVVYWPGMHLGPWVSYLWNALWVFCIVGGYCAFLARVLRLSAPLVILACASFFYAWDLLQHLSLQEKMVLSFGLCTVWLAWNRARFSVVGFWGLFLLAAGLGFSSKASFAIHFCVAVVAFVSAQADSLKAGSKRSWIESGVVALIGIAIVLAYAKISSGGSYTSSYDFRKALPNLLSPQGLMLALPLALALLALALRWKEVWRSPEILLPAVGVSAFMALFLPWGIQAYVQSVMAPFFAAMLIQLAGWWLARLPRAVWVLPLCLLALAVTTYRSITIFGRLSDLGTLTAMGPSLMETGVKELWMPCDEGSLSMGLFMKSIGTPVPEVKYLRGAPEQGVEKFVAFDQALCPLPGRADHFPGCQMKMLWKGSWPKSYRLAKVTCFR